VNHDEWWLAIGFSVAWALMGEWAASSAFVAASFVISALDK
jgi:hypothetical protein